MLLVNVYYCLTAQSLTLYTRGNYFLTELLNFGNFGMHSVHGHYRELGCLVSNVTYSHWVL